MVGEIGLAALTALIPPLMYLLTLAGLHLGPNHWIGFRLPSVMGDRERWTHLHRSLLPLLRRQCWASIGFVPLIVVRLLAPEFFPLLLVAYIALMVLMLAMAISAALSRERDHH